MPDKSSPLESVCPECGKGHMIALSRSEEFDFDLGDETVKVHAENVPVLVCDQCGEVMSGPDAARVRHDAVCRAAGYTTPAEYKAIREKLNWTQQNLADLTGFGIATVSRAERGRLLPNRSYNKVLLALRDCPPFRENLQHQLASLSDKPDRGVSTQKESAAPPLVLKGCSAAEPDLENV